MPPWIEKGYQEYAKRLQSTWMIELIKLPPEKRTLRAHLPKLVRREGEKILSIIKPQHVVVALEIKGKSYSTEELALQLKRWQNEGLHHIDFIIGGADGLSQECLQKANEKWSLSRLTFPHALVPVILVEQIYRSFCILNQHPYHR